jgi:hypothetical protein
VISLSNIHRQKQENRRIENSFIGNLHNIRLPFCLRPLYPLSHSRSAVMFVFSSIFHAAEKKGYNELKGKKTLLIFGLMLFYRKHFSIHLSQYSTQINHFYAFEGERAKKSTRIFNLSLFQICHHDDS